MNLIMITPRVGTSNELFAFIPTWIKYLSQKIDQLWVITPRYEKITLPANVEVYEVGRDYSKHETLIHALMHFHQKMWHLINHNHVDGIFAHMYPMFALLAAPYARIRKIQLILWYTHTSLNWQLKIAEKVVDQIFTATHGTCQLRSEKIFPVGHGIDTNFFINSQTKNFDNKNKSKTIITVGRISPIKNLQTIIEAAYLLIKTQNIRNIKFSIIGEPPNQSHVHYYNELIREVNQLGLENYIIFKGRVSHYLLPTEYSKCDFFVSACNSGLDKAILEAMSCELPPILSNQEFIPILKHHSDLLMYPENDPKALAEKIVYLLSLTSHEYIKLGKEMRNIILKYHNIENLTTKIIRVFNQ